MCQQLIGWKIMKLKFWNKNISYYLIIYDKYIIKNIINLKYHVPQVFGSNLE